MGKLTNTTQSNDSSRQALALWPGHREKEGPKIGPLVSGKALGEMTLH